MAIGIEEIVDEIQVEIVEYDYYVEGQLLHENARDIIITEEPKDDRIYFDGKVHIEGQPGQKYGLTQCQYCGYSDFATKSPDRVWCTYCEKYGYTEEGMRKIGEITEKLEKLFIDEEDRIKSFTEYDAWEGE